VLASGLGSKFLGLLCMLPIHVTVANAYVMVLLHASRAAVYTARPYHEHRSCICARFAQCC
jgi:hypothetical protein